jgi:hypothetical protein
MGFMSGKWEETAELLRSQLTPMLEPGEALIGAVHATEPKTFSANIYIIGVTPNRLIVVPVDRRMNPNGKPVRNITRADITGSSVWGHGGSIADWIGDGDQQIRIETAEGKLKLMVLGGNFLENKLAGDDHLRGLDALVEFVLSARST